METPLVPPALASRFSAALAGGDADAALGAIAELAAEGQSKPCEQWLSEAWERFPEDPRFAVRLIELQVRYRSFEAFEGNAATALKRHPADPDVHYAIGCGHEGRGLWSAAARSFGRAAELAPDEIEPVLRQVRSLRIEQHREEALRVLREALVRHPGTAELHAAVGYTLIELRRTDEAVREFERAVERKPDWPPYLDDLASALMLAERYAEAARAATRSLEKRKHNERAWTVYAGAHAKLGDPARAEQGYRNAIRAAKDPSRAQGNFGLFLAKDPARLLEAVRMLKSALAAHPDWREVSEALDRLLDSPR